MRFTETARFEKVQPFYLIRGHSFDPCDWDFRIIKRKIHKFTAIIIQSKFTVNEVKNDEILDFKACWTASYKKDYVSVETQNF